MTNYKKYMKKCIKLALKAEGKTSPNPLVGCVVLDKNGKEIATGYHKAYGELHAEADALSKLKNNEAKGGTLIVNLEPCCHWGKTPPCVDLIIKKGIKRLVIGMKDPNPIVSGESIEKCKKAGIEVIEDVLHDEVFKLNEIFVKNMTKKECFVAIKTATTLDGKIATRTGSSKWITSEKARKEVQKIRNRYDAILTTSSTIIKDNPSMTCTLKNGKNPIKIILDRELKTDLKSKIYQTTGEKIYIVVDENIEISKITSVTTHVAVIKCPSNNYKLDLGFLFEKLYELGIKSVLVEAGGKLNGEIISLGLADKIYQFIAPKILGDEKGINAFEGRKINEINNSLRFEFASIYALNQDILIISMPIYTPL
ncbi:MAG: bifunctional diaminohydroxyphosphoribosylaminopyrimidine deaminase/5-amino-6-(5-phosphoribosylamino)uracil reductase RibD [Candidatus Gastranaerophilales bacterium]|nr:bifunctional diaminohydroxyphosphoribosylaminopyrimidine deaminase/5-amino-6-(5-phosphoribosylamino)uracil reductase RibD [Candidatus Gastranaerophilales bacterium]